jgi:hypothetical protein
MPSNPTIEMSSGTRRGGHAAACGAPIAITSLPTRMAVGRIGQLAAGAGTALLAGLPSGLVRVPQLAQITRAPLRRVPRSIGPQARTVNERCSRRWRAVRAAACFAGPLTRNAGRGWPVKHGARRAVWFAVIRVVTRPRGSLLGRRASGPAGAVRTMPARVNASLYASERADSRLQCSVVRVCSTRGSSSSPAVGPGCCVLRSSRQQAKSPRRATQRSARALPPRLISLDSRHSVPLSYAVTGRGDKGA